MSTSFHSTCPADARVTVAIILISVDFPAPFGPSNPTTPAPSSSRKSRNPHTFPAYCLLTPSITSFIKRPLLRYRHFLRKRRRAASIPRARLSPSLALLARLRIYQH